MIRLDSLSGLLSFVHTAQTGSFTAAAQRMGITKSAVSKAVSVLEQRLEVKLLHRSTRRLSLTVDGENYLASCVNALGEIDEAELVLKSQLREPVGRLRIDVPAAFGRQLVLPILLDIARKNPGLKLAMTFSDRFCDPIEEGIDLLVRIGYLTDSSELVARQLTSHKLVICASPAYLAERGIPFSLPDLNAHDCIVGFRRDTPQTWPLHDPSSRESLRYTPAQIHELGDGAAMLDCVLAGCGLSQLPTWLIHRELAAGTLVTVLDNYSGSDIPISLMWPRTRQLLPKVRVVVDELIRQCDAGAFG